MADARESQTVLDKKMTMKSPLAGAQSKQSKKKDAVPESPRSVERPEPLGRKTSVVHMPPPKTPLHRPSGAEQSLRSKKPKVDAEKALGDWLKRYCLTKFDNATARRIMYKPEESKFASSIALKFL